MDLYFHQFHARFEDLRFFLVKKKYWITSASSNGDGGRAKNCSWDVKPESCDEILDIRLTATFD